MTDIFISYSSKDRGKACRLACELKSAGGRVWFDQEQVLPGDNIIEQMRDGIARCQYYVLCLSPAFDEQPPTSWVRKEFQMAMLKEHRERRRLIIPIRLKKGGSIPLEIAERAYADVSTAKRWKRNFPRLCRALGLTTA